MSMFKKLICQCFFVVVNGCNSSPDSLMNTLKTLSPLPEIPSSPTNAYADNPQAAMLGQKFFFDKSVSGPLGPIGSSGGLGAVGETGKIACNSCHVAQTRFIDTRSMPNNLSSGADGYLPHNAPSLVNSVFYTWFNTDGARDSQWRCGATAFETIKANNS